MCNLSIWILIPILLFLFYNIFVIFFDFFVKSRDVIGWFTWCGDYIRCSGKMVCLMLLLLLNNLKLWSVMLLEIYAFFQIFATNGDFTFALFGKGWCWAHSFFYVGVRRLICGFAKIAMRMRFIILQRYHEILYASQVETMSTG